MNTQTTEPVGTEVRAILINNPKVAELENLQRRFSGQLNIVPLKDGNTGIYPEPWIKDEFDEFASFCMDLRVQAIDLRRSA